MKDEYIKKYKEIIKKCSTDEQLTRAINKIYTDGFQDGKEEK